MNTDDDAVPLPDPNPWQPMTRSIDIKYIGKTIEELGEAVSALGRALIQGIDEKEPTTGKPNRDWVEDELADVAANMHLMTQHFKLSVEKMNKRKARKIAHLTQWHEMLAEPATDPNIKVTWIKKCAERFAKSLDLPDPSLVLEYAIACWGHEVESAKSDDPTNFDNAEPDDAADAELENWRD